MRDLAIAITLAGVYGVYAESLKKRNRIQPDEALFLSTYGIDGARMYACVWLSKRGWFGGAE